MIAGKNRMTPDRSRSKCLTNKKENKKAEVINNRSQQKIIHLGAYLFLKKLSSIRLYWGQQLESIPLPKQITIQTQIIEVIFRKRKHITKTRSIPQSSF
jgi:hypothetical protein